MDAEPSCLKESRAKKHRNKIRRHGDRLRDLRELFMKKMELFSSDASNSQIILQKS